MKRLSKILSILLVLSLISGCGTANTGIETGTEMEKESVVQTDSNDELFLSLTESTSESLSFSLTEEQAAQIEKAGADQVTWTLHRTESYGNPADG